MKIHVGGTSYHKNGGATAHPGENWCSSQYDGRSDWYVRAWVGMSNIGSISGELEEFCNEIRKMMVEVRCRGQGYRIFCVEEKRFNI